MEYEEPDDEEVEMHMTYVPADDAGYPEEEDGPINMVSRTFLINLRTNKQDADFDGAEPSSKKRKKNKKGKNKAVEREEVDEADDENLTVAEKAKKVKKAMEEYKALDHEDMVRDPHRCTTCRD
jgi:protein KRI1